MKMLFAFGALVVSICVIQPASAAKITYTNDVAPILYENCLRCHRPGEAAPMSLRTYDETRPWAKAIQEKVVKKEMPPWFADPAHGEFRNDASLTEDEIKLINDWVEQGATRGNPKDMPQYPEFTEGWQNGIPDQIIEMPEVNVPADGSDYFPNLMFKADVEENKWVQGIEIRPSNLEVAHHVVVFGANFGSGGGGVGAGNNFDVLGTWAVGTAPNVYPDGMGRTFSKGQRFMANMHYHPNGVATKDQTKIGLYFGEGEMKHEIMATLAGTMGFRIPANAPNHQEINTWNLEKDIKIISFFPHMHLRGKDMLFNVKYPDGRKNTMLNVPKWDFNWQLFYYPKEPLLIPKGSEIDLIAHYDNSKDNPNNPDPNVSVGFGLQSTEEMMFGIIEYIEDTEPTETD